ncbi:MAG: hypothetical protein ABII12_05270 [Planctomycetota bacterium]
MSHRVNVHRPPTIVSLRDAGGFQVSVKNADQPRRHVKQRRIRRETQRHRSPDTPPCVVSDGFQLVGKPFA